jgi:hypothetical protein
MDSEAWLLCLLLAIQVVFQAKIAAGAPYGRISYGGNHEGRLPKNYRIASAVSVLVYLFFISVVVAYSSDLNTYSETFSRSVLWGMVVFFGLGTLANAASKSKPERWWALYALATLLCTLFVLDVF